MSLSRSSRRRRHASPKPPATPRKRSGRYLMGFALAGMNAWRARQDEAASRKLAALEDGSTPSPELDLDHPWWCIALTTDPIFLSIDERAGCEMLMALLSKGAPGLDWPRVALRSMEIFDELALAGGSQAKLHLCPFDMDEDAIDPQPGSRHLRLGGRCYVAMPGYEEADFWDNLSSGDGAFDRRRARRRQGRLPPEQWQRDYGAVDAQKLWSSGFSPTQSCEEPFDDWAASIQALAQAMREAGAARVERVPGFFAQFPRAMEDDNIDSIEAKRSDPLRQRWDIEAASGPAGAKRRPLSI